MRVDPQLLERFISDLDPNEPDLFGRSVRPDPVVDQIHINGADIVRLTHEFWTSGQRQASSLHEISYRACFKPQLPAFFIKRFTKPGDWVLDPFSGRGTTAVEAALSGRKVIANDINPLSAMLARPRLSPPGLKQITGRLAEIPYDGALRADMDLSMFYDPKTESEIVSLREYLRARRASRTEDSVDAWIRMVATNRLTGHSPGFFSVYTFPPNQAVSPKAQARINERRNQRPEYRDTKAIIMKKSRQLLGDVGPRELSQLRQAAADALFVTGQAQNLSQVRDGSVQLTVTSPPFLDVVQYADDNWLRCWFNALPLDEIAGQITLTRSMDKWSEIMGEVLAELFRVTRDGGVVAFEVGEIRKGTIKLEEAIIPPALAAGFRCEAILIHVQHFTKTANLWGVTNNSSGTNSNRIVVLRKE